MQALAGSPVFDGIPFDARGGLLDGLGASVRRLAEGQVLRRAGEALDFFPVVVAGRIEATMPQGGQNRVVSQFGPGESFAEAVPNTLKFSPVNMQALCDTTLLCIPAEPLLASGDAHAVRLRENLAREMSKKIMVLSQTLSVVGEPRLSDRIMAYLRTLPKEPDGTVLVPLGRQEWAAYLRVADKSLIRELRALQDAGQIDVHGRSVRITGE